MYSQKLTNRPTVIFSYAGDTDLISCLPQLHIIMRRFWKSTTIKLKACFLLSIQEVIDDSWVDIHEYVKNFKLIWALCFMLVVKYRADLHYVIQNTLNLGVKCDLHYLGLFLLNVIYIFLSVWYSIFNCRFHIVSSLFKILAMKFAQLSCNHYGSRIKRLILCIWNYKIVFYLINVVTASFQKLYGWDIQVNLIC